jgi:hypothetical protein
MSRPVLKLKPKAQHTDIAVPQEWIKGELLNVQRFSDGSYTISRLQDEPRDPRTQMLKFDNSSDCQNFVSRWYAPQSRGQFG